MKSEFQTLLRLKSLKNSGKFRSSTFAALMNGLAIWAISKARS
jgi:hypothetical protein